MKKGYKFISLCGIATILASCNNYSDSVYLTPQTREAITDVQADAGPSPVPTVTATPTETSRPGPIVPSVQWQVPNSSVSESVGSVQVVATLSPASSNPVSVSFSVSGTATAQSDHNAVSGSITIPAGSTTGVASVQIINDNVIESSETIVLTMGVSVGAAKGANTVHTITITDNDSIPSAILPVISGFSIPSTSNSLTVPVTTFTTTHSSPITGYIISESSTQPLSTSSRWVATVPKSYVATSAGAKTLYAWVKDGAGNVSNAVSRNVTITLPAPTPTATATPTSVPVPTPAEPITGKAYYLSPSGSDTSGTGTQSNPWFTMNKAWGVVQGGDVIYLRGGTYRYNSQQDLHNKGGSSGKTIKIWAYPGEKPIITPSSSYDGKRGIDLWYANYVHIKGLEISGFVQRSSTSFYYGIAAQNSSFNTFENLNVHDNGFGLSIGSDSGDNLVLNSDFHRNADPMTKLGSNIPWGGADGITIRTSDPSRTNTIRGCRMWWNSDDGVDLFNNEGTIIIENSWAFWNGYQPGNFSDAGDGNGLKIGPTVTDQSTKIRRILRNNLVFQNKKRGVDQNNNRSITLLYNNTSYKNGYTGIDSRGFDFWNGTAATIAKNNLAFGEALGSKFNSQAIVTNNTFLKDSSVNSSYNVTTSDFLSLDNAGVIGPRRSDGSLPVLNFLRLAPGSDLINRGTDVGLPFNGAAPDLGAFETN